MKLAVGMNPYDHLNNMDKNWQILGRLGPPSLSLGWANLE